MKSPLPTQAMADSSRLDVMNFLNEIAERHPQAISFASGRPSEAFFELERWMQRIPDFIQHVAEQRQASVACTFNSLAQYGRTNGIVNDLIARQVNLDENISCKGEQIVVTSGCQEAIDLCVTTLCRSENDVVLVRSPTYIGITGVADLNGIGLAPFSCDHAGDVGDTLEQAVAAAERQGKCPRILYLVPNFDNPSGTVLAQQTREEIIALCASKNIVVLEDNPYGMFRYEGEPVPSMYTLDTQGCVIHLGTYSKTLCPTLRVGYAIVPERLRGDPAGGRALVEQLSKAKSFSTVNTSQIAQAIVGGVLLAESGSLSRLVGPAIAFYKNNRDVMLACLSKAFSVGENNVSWNSPQGGFFLTVTLPFEFKQREAEICARDYGVVAMPLSFFALNNAQDCSVRLAFSNVTPDHIKEGINRFSRFVKDRIEADLY